MTQPQPNNDPVQQLDIIERTYCSCNKCQLACQTMPGSLAPGDASKIARYLNREPDDTFMEANFEASDGTRILTREGMMMIPTIVPQQRDDGSCVFLGESGNCMIHPVAPYGCRNFNVCGKGQTRMDEDHRSSVQIHAIVMEEGHEYVKQWAKLKQAGCEARPKEERRFELERKLAEIENSGE